jgi:hypothetical protein
VPQRYTPVPFWWRKNPVGPVAAALAGMPAELVAVDVLLDDPSFFEPFRKHFDPVWGRPSIPIET